MVCVTLGYHVQIQKLEVHFVFLFTVIEQWFLTTGLMSNFRLNSALSFKIEANE